MFKISPRPLTAVLGLGAGQLDVQFPLRDKAGNGLAQRLPLKAGNSAAVIVRGAVGSTFGPHVPRARARFPYLLHGHANMLGGVLADEPRAGLQPVGYAF